MNKTWLGIMLSAWLLAVVFLGVDHAASSRDAAQDNFSQGVAALAPTRYQGLVWAEL